MGFCLRKRTGGGDADCAEHQPGEERESQRRGADFVDLPRGASWRTLWRPARPWGWNDYVNENAAELKEAFGTDPPRSRQRNTGTTKICAGGRCGRGKAEREKRTAWWRVAALAGTEGATIEGNKIIRPRPAVATGDGRGRVRLCEATYNRKPAMPMCVTALCAISTTQQIKAGQHMDKNTMRSHSIAMWLRELYGVDGRSGWLAGFESTGR